MRARARSAVPCVLFLDPVEAIAGKRGTDGSGEQTMERLLSCLLEAESPAMRGSEERALLVAALPHNNEPRDLHTASRATTSTCARRRLALVVWRRRL